MYQYVHYYCTKRLQLCSHHCAAASSEKNSRSKRIEHTFCAPPSTRFPITNVTPRALVPVSRLRKKVELSKSAASATEKRPFSSVDPLEAKVNPPRPLRAAASFASVLLLLLALVSEPGGGSGAPRGVDAPVCASSTLSSVASTSIS